MVICQIHYRRHSNPNFRYQSQQPNQTQRPNFTVTPQNGQQQKTTPMEIDGSGQYAQKTQVQANNFQQKKRPLESSFQYKNKQSPSFHHMTKQQRVNHVEETDDIRSIYDDSLDNNCETEIPDCQSTTSEQGSIFFRRVKNLPCIIRTLKSGMKEIKIFVDSGSTNYIKTKLQIGNRAKLNKINITKTPRFFRNKIQTGNTIIESEFGFF